MFQDNRSHWEKLKSGQRLRRWTTTSALFGSALYVMLSRHARDGSWTARVNASLDRLVEWTDDTKETAVRIGKYLWTGKVTDRDPTVARLLNKSPFRRIRRSLLPLLPDVEHLNFPRPVPTLLLDLDKVVAELTYDQCHGWRALKRPFADKFFKDVMFNYEIVIWTKQPFPVTMSLFR
eukprot:Protomagalhaensia_wolfi_Nauph_80__136@NODE_1078_length_1756_cov_8_590565_g820_i0_p1_GENE_NODE_1078_length_1756_cov_8_590565_g820_i0NODE_1078_length_1756_cov_8_590565_g820_i0_p1_ORF_typecomplete_len178_score12_30NIF/PF03031_18/1e03NIF/PF03031_18/3e07_NODE_1078_length_1756_cov_8_590565_g820_i011571690